MTEQVAPALADLGVRIEPRSPGALTVPGDRGDSILIEFQPISGGFFVNVSNHLLPWTAWLHEVTLDDARAGPAQTWDRMFETRLVWPASTYVPEIWTVTPETAGQVITDLSTVLRRSLSEVWLPILPRPALRALIRDPARKGPSPLRWPLVQDLMCGIEDLNEADLRGLVNYLRGRRETNEDYPVLAAWIERVFSEDYVLSVSREAADD